MLINVPAKLRDFGLLLLRLGAGLFMFIGHGWGKIVAGPEQWEGLGGTMELIGITFLPVVWGFMAALAESVAAVLLAVGFLTRTAALLLIGTMGMAAFMHLSRGDGLFGQGSAEMALLYGFIFLTFFITGPGKYSVDALMGNKRR